MSIDYNKSETNLRRLLAATERLAATSAREIALEATAASAFSQGRLQQAVSYKSPFVVTLFKKVRRFSFICPSIVAHKIRQNLMCPPVFQFS